MPKHKKRCGHCKQVKEIGAFYRDRSQPDGRYRTCIGCYGESRKPKQKTIRATRNRWQQRLREEVLKHYGGRCACCGEKRFEFLTVSRIERGKRTQGSSQLPWWLKKHGFPKGFRVLCANCSGALGRYGYCPHGNAV